MSIRIDKQKYPDFFEKPKKKSKVGPQRSTMSLGKISPEKEIYTKETIEGLTGLSKIIDKELQDMPYADPYDGKLFIRETVGSSGIFQHITAPYNKEAPHD